MAETINDRCLYKIGNKILKIGGKLLTVHNDTQTYQKSYSGDASDYADAALSAGNYLELEPRTYHIEFNGTFSLNEADRYRNCRVAIFGDDPSSDSIYPPYTFTYISPDFSKVTIEGSADIDLTQHPDLKYFAFLRDNSSVMGTVVGTITATRHT
jgi:hypothetical protein